ncbi:MAG: zinc metallopeptidase [Bacteroidetes bacterium]|nr:MAG: zinc metallopeptidase [Bacteroidota bacterium]
MGGLWLILIIFTAIGGIVSATLRNKFNKYSKIPNDAYITGAEAARRMLEDNGIYDVKITSVPGQLTDHYNPVTKTINLSPEVYNGKSIASVAVAAHETGHALQHAHGYAFLKLRSALVPVVSISSTLMNFIFIAGFLFGFIFHLFSTDTILLVIILAQGSITLFSLITLPVEFDASYRGLQWLQNTGIVQGDKYTLAKDALKWAAMTYVVAALAALAQLLYYLAIFTNRRN